MLSDMRCKVSFCCESRAPKACKNQPRSETESIGLHGQRASGFWAAGAPALPTRVAIENQITRRRTCMVRSRGTPTDVFSL